MRDTELHSLMSDTLRRLKNGTIDPKKAKGIFHGASQLIGNCRNELTAIKLGIPCDVPLLGISQLQVKKGKDKKKLK